MKKSLLVAAAALGLFATTTAHAYDVTVVNPPVSPVNNGTYYIFDAAGDDGSNNEQACPDGYSGVRYAFRHDNNGNIHGTHIKAANAGSSLTNNHVWKAITTDDGATWQFQNVGTQKYIKQAGAATSDVESERGTFVIEGTDPNAFKVKVDGTNNRWDGNGTGNFPMVYWAGTGHDIRFYEAVAVGDGYELAAQNGWNVTYSYTFPDGQKITKVADVADGADASANIPNLPFGLFTATGVTQSDKTVKDGNVTFDVVGDWNYFGKFGRILNRKGNDGRAYWQYVDGAINAKNTTNANALDASRLFRLNGTYENGEYYVSIENVKAGEGKYLNITVQDAVGTNDGVFETSAMKFKLVANSAFSEAGFSLQCPDNSAAYVQNYNNSNNIGYWKGSDSQNDQSSFIQFFALTEDDWTSAANELRGMVGEGWGNYSIAADYEETYNGVIAKLESMTTVANPTMAQVAEALAVSAADVEEHLTLNQLTPGFYRFYGAKYLTSNPATATDNAGRILMSNGIGDGNNGAETVVYVDADRRVVSLSNGLVLGKFAGSNDRKFVHKSSADAGIITIYRSSEANKFNISLDNGAHYIYNATVANEEAVVDRGGNSNGAAPAGTGYCWTIEPATYIPVPVGDADHVTIYSPMPLENTSNRFELFTLTPNGEHAEIVKLEAEGNIEPNTVYYAKVNRNGVDAATKCSFLKVLDATTASQNETEGETETVAAPEINGSIYATEKAEGASYYTMGVKDSAAHFLAHEGDYIPGFTAHIATAAPSTAVANLGGYKLVTESEKTTTGINEINAGAANGAKVIYDLQGRRVQHAAKGLYIINGVKTLVK